MLQGTVAQANDVDLFALSLDELRNIRVSVASGIPESLLDAASSSAVLLAEDWQARGLRRSNEAFGLLPGVAVMPLWAGADAVVIRGYATEASAQGVATLIDGIPVNTFVYGTARYDKGELGLGSLSRIEVIRGPGSTLYGNDAFHGVIAYHSFTRETEFRSLTAEASDDQYTALSGQYAGAAFDGWLDVAVDARQQGLQDREYRYSRPVAGQGERGFGYDSQTFSARYRHGNADTGEWQLALYGNRYHSEEMPGPGGQFFAGNAFTLDRDHLGTDSDFLLLRGEYRQALSENLLWRARYGIWRNHHDWRFDGSRYSAFCAPGWTDPSTECVLGIPGHIANQYSEERHQHLSTDLQIDMPEWQSQWTTQIGWQRAAIGDAYLRRSSLEPNWTGFTTEAAYAGNDRELTYVLGQGRSSWFERQLALVYGLRYDRYDDVGSHTSPRLGMVYQPTPDWALKLLYGHAFKAPNALQMTGSGTVFGNPALKPETIDTLELALMHSTGPWQLELAAFQSDWRDAIILTSGPDLPVGAARYENFGRNAARGSELVVNYFGEQLLMQANATVVSSRNRTDHIDYVAFPHYLANLAIGMPFGQGRGKWLLMQQYRGQQYESDYLSTPSGPVKPARIDDYWRLDWQIEYQLGTDWRIAGGIYNLLDRDNVMPSLYNSESGIADRARAVQISLRWH
ncbi:MAG TPA: TonB-dependent receptor [Permianibacter sp.]|nr:TonB-dependent receptor [Permianibacter sp.]